MNYSKLTKLSSIALAIFALGCSSSSNDVAQPVKDYTLTRTADGPLAQKETEVVQAEAVVEKVDMAKRKLTIRNAANEVSTLSVSPEVKRLAEIKVGDKIAVSYLRSLAFEVRQPTALEKKNPRSIAAAEAIADPSLPPGALVGAVTKTIVTIKDIDLANSTATIKLPEGDLVTIKARHPENLTRVHKGDTVAVTYGEAMAIGVGPLKPVS